MVSIVVQRVARARSEQLGHAILMHGSIEMQTIVCKRIGCSIRLGALTLSCRTSTIWSHIVATMRIKPERELKRVWSNGRIPPCQGEDAGSIPATRRLGQLQSIAELGRHLAALPCLNANGEVTGVIEFSSVVHGHTSASLLSKRR